MDSFYKGISTAEDKEAAKRGDYNFDCPAGKIDSCQEWFLSEFY